MSAVPGESVSLVPPLFPRGCPPSCRLCRQWSFHLLASRLDTACAARALDTVIPTLGQYETIFWIPFHCPDVGHPRPHPPRALGSSPPRVNPHPYQKPRKCLVRKPSVILGSADGPWVAPTGHLTFQMAASWEKSFSFQTPLPPFIRDFEILEDSDKY